jgi:crotonobetainyl-CoA:carnitine CoA-transferase CaiB-like acyl-CoA transferase
MTRQTGRHAAPAPTAPVQVRCADGRYACTGVLPTQPRQFAALHAWLAELSLLGRLPEAVFLELGAARGTRVDIADIGNDPEGASILAAARDAISLIASELSAYDFYVASQEHGFPAGAEVSPDEAFEDPHFVARGVQIEVDHDGRSFRFPGPGLPVAPGLSTRLPRAPHVDEHGETIRAELQERARG